ncbi:MAG: glycosyltransferase family 39 protein [Candidatus Poribacteria bacterium]|nr:glycosyltransferase family 39 protein [Candidatus Poribacteria bacterium]
MIVAAARFLRAHWSALTIGALCFASALLKLPHLGHQHLGYDEACHAIVARNLLKHPLTPTLYDTPHLSYTHKSWTSNHIWLHKPILPLWKIAASYAVFGVNTFVLRFPSLILASLSVFLTYLIGRELFGRSVAFAAASIQAFLPTIAELTHGYLFSDAIDISLLFWTEFAVYFLIRAMKSGRWRDVLLAGFGQGCAYLSKSYLALIVTGIALAILLAPAFRLGRREDSGFRLRHLLGLIGASLVVALPWTVSTAIRFPQEFHHEHGYVFRHLVSNIEHWGAPWDRLLFDYFPFLLHAFFASAMVAVIALLKPLLTEKRISLCIAYAWGFGVLAPNLLAATKTPSAVLIAVPAFLLILGEFISRAVSKGGRSWELCVLTGSALVVLVLPQAPIGWGRGAHESDAFGAILLERPWPVISIAIAFAVAWAAYWIGSRLVQHARSDAFRWLCFGFVIAAGLTLVWRSVWVSSLIAGGGGTPTPYAKIADSARNNLPSNAVLFVEITEEMSPVENLKVMFFADRPAYRFRSINSPNEFEEVLEKGGMPYLLSTEPSDWEVVFRDVDNKAAVYDWPRP